MLLAKAERAYVEGTVKPSMQELQMMDEMSQQLRGRGFAHQKSGGGITEFAKGFADELLLGIPSAIGESIGMGAPTTLAQSRSRGAGGILGFAGSLLTGGALLKSGKLLGLADKGIKSAQATINARDSVTKLSTGKAALRGVQNFATGGKQAAKVGAVYGGIAGAADAARDESGEFTGGGEMIAGAVAQGGIGATLGLLGGGGISAYKRSVLASKRAVLTANRASKKAAAAAAVAATATATAASNKATAAAAKATAKVAARAAAKTNPVATAAPPASTPSVAAKAPTFRSEAKRRSQAIEISPDGSYTGAAKGRLAKHAKIAKALEDNPNLSKTERDNILSSIESLPTASARNKRYSEILSGPTSTKRYKDFFPKSAADPVEPDLFGSVPVSSTKPATAEDVGKEFGFKTVIKKKPSSSATDTPDPSRDPDGFDWL